jgi:hypothetical protein
MANTVSRLPKFPGDLAIVVAQRWGNLVGGEYIVPHCPSPKILKLILELSYVAASAAEEGRYPQFNVLVTPRSVETSALGGQIFHFDEARSLTASELRRLAPASDFRKSAVWVTYEDETAVIEGLVDLGTSWHRARLGFTYRDRVPSCLIVQVDRPGRVKVYQGEFHVATLADGDLIVSRGIDMNLFLHDVVHQGLRSLAVNYSVPRYEQSRDFEEFWFIAHWNVFTAIVNSISLLGHGGTLVIAAQDAEQINSSLRVKYSGSTDMLRDAFVRFINARNKTADFYERAEQQSKPVSKNVFEAERQLQDASDELIEAVRFVAQLAGCDGAIVISPDLTVRGFGAEIRAEMQQEISVLEVIDEMRKKYKVCDIEQFGMRHRSAVKLVSRAAGSLILAVSQDGPISAVWRDPQGVLVKKGVSLVNLNMPWT